MKRTDLKVGEAYYHDRSAKWDDSSYGKPGKAVIVDASRWSPGGRWNDWKPVEDRKGTGVLVDLTETNWNGEPTTKRTVVPVTHLRGPYEQTKATVDANTKLRKERYAASAQRQQELDARKEVVQERAKAIGISVFGIYGTGTDVHLSVGDLERLLDAYDKLTTKD